MQSKNEKDKEGTYQCSNLLRGLRKGTKVQKRYVNLQISIKFNFHQLFPFLKIDEHHQYFNFNKQKNVSSDARRLIKVKTWELQRARNVKRKRRVRESGDCQDKQFFLRLTPSL